MGKAILENCLLKGPLSDKTRILVTHALHVLPHTDYIYVMDGGVVVEEGTYQVCHAPYVDLPMHNCNRIFFPKANHSLALLKNMAAKTRPPEKKRMKRLK